jgi:GDP-4-dehydro-6-deoxy-D-mannose reductase
MRVLITGATGFAGRHLAKLCASRDAHVVGLGRRPHESPATADLNEYVTADLTSPGGTRAAIRAAAPDAVFHLAAEASVAVSWKAPEATIRANLDSTLNVLEAVRHDCPEAHVLVVCSGEEYGNHDSLPLTEDHVLRPQNPYAVSKAACDLAAGFYADAYGMHVVRMRAFNHAGPGQSDAYVISKFARQIAEAGAGDRAGEPVEIVTGNLHVRRDFTDVRDVVRAYWLALERAQPGVYNVCSGRSTEISEILAGLARHAGVKLQQTTDPALLREHEVIEIRGSHEKLTAASGWEPEIPLERTLADTVEWWRERAVAGVAG